jgi:DNA-binding protein HU-beta
MNTSDLIERVHETVPNLSKAQSKQAVQVTLEAIVTGLKAGEVVTLKGFGTFRTSVASARKGRNPITGETIDIPESTRVKFKPSQALKDTVAKQ